MSAFAILVFVATAIAEILGCYLVFLWRRHNGSPVLLLGAAITLGLFAWLLSAFPTAGRAYAAYGGVYVACAVVWGWLVEKNTPDRWDLAGAAVCLIGMAIITFGPHGNGNAMQRAETDGAPQLTSLSPTVKSQM